jgi:hypothetical protein
MGACLTTMVQAQAEPYDAVALLGYAVEITNVHDETLDAGELTARIDQSEAAFRATTGTPPGAVFTVVPRGHLHRLFHAPDVPKEVIAADDAAESRVPVRAASQVTTPGFVRQYAQAVGAPVLLALGDVDVSPDPHAEPANYPASRDVTLLIVPGSGHCHNFAGTRTALWDRIAAWVPAVTSS